jgi:hypothetical protein
MTFLHYHFCAVGGEPKVSRRRVLSASPVNWAESMRKILMKHLFVQQVRPYVFVGKQRRQRPPAGGSE